MESSLLYQKIIALPDNLKEELNDFLDFLYSKIEKKNVNKRPKFGSAKGTFTLSEDFDEPLDDFKEYAE